MNKIVIVISVAVVSVAIGYFVGSMKSMVDEKALIIEEGMRQSKGGENFDDFLLKFLADSLFQLDRIKFPLKSQQWDLDEVDSTRIERNDWTTIRLFYRNQYRPQIYDNFKGEMRDTDERLFVWEGIENGINVEYRFRRIEGHWFLVEFADFSD